MNYRKVKKILESPITILDFLILESIANNLGDDYVNDLSLIGHIEFLRKEELISDNYKLTLKGKTLLEGFNRLETKSSNNFFTNLHKKLQDKLVELTGKKQKLLQGKYGFIPNEKDLTLRLQKVIKKYSLEDLDKVEKVLLSYIEKSYRARFEYVNTVEYYILKNDSSRLATDYEGFTGQEESIQDNAVNI